MDAPRFDHLTRLLARGSSRRAAVSALLGALLGLEADESGARKARNRRDGDARNRRQDARERGNDNRVGAESKRRKKGKKGKPGKKPPKPVANACDQLAIVPGQTFTNCEFAGRDLRRADLRGARFINTDLSNANLEGANLQSASFTDSKLIAANLRGADFSRDPSAAPRRQRAARNQAGEDDGGDGSGEAPIETGGGASFTSSDLSQADLTNANLQSASFSESNLSDVDLTGADMRGATFEGGTLQGATFDQTVMPDGTVDSGSGCETICRSPQLLSASCQCVCPEGTQTCPLCGSGSGGTGGNGGNSGDCRPCVRCLPDYGLSSINCRCVECAAPVRDMCDGLCRNVQTDRNHCGSCGAACSPDKVCMDGGCVCETAAQRCANGVCISCASNMLTDLTACACICPEDLTDCTSGNGGTGGNSGNGDSTRCVDLQTNPRHCGSCRNDCPSGVPCIGGVCACAEEEVCDGACRDLSANRNHCGACGVACLSSEVCVGGACVCPPGHGRCASGVCLQCPGGMNPDHEACSCSCPNELIDCSQPPGSGGNAGTGGNSGSRCADLMSDRDHCGACFNRCRSGSRCVDGVCACEEDALPCVDGQCRRCDAPFELDPQSCSCGCPSGGVRCNPCGNSGSAAGGDGNCTSICVRCESGQAPDPATCACVACSLENQAVCSGLCRDIMANPNHCGECDLTCPNGNDCIDGFCRCRPGLTQCLNGACGSCQQPLVLDDRFCHCTCPSGTERCTPGGAGTGAGGIGDGGSTLQCVPPCPAGETRRGSDCSCQPSSPGGGDG